MYLRLSDDRHLVLAHRRTRAPKFDALKEGNPYEHLDCTNAWVSCGEDTSSQEWANAVMVKKSMSVAIDRQAFVDTLLSGFGNAIAPRTRSAMKVKPTPVGDRISIRPQPNNCSILIINIELCIVRTHIR